MSSWHEDNMMIKSCGDLSPCRMSGSGPALSMHHLLSSCELGIWLLILLTKKLTKAQRGVVTCPASNPARMQIPVGLILNLPFLPRTPPFSKDLQTNPNALLRMNPQKLIPMSGSGSSPPQGYKLLEGKGCVLSITVCPGPFPVQRGELSERALGGSRLL